MIQSSKQYQLEKNIWTDADYDEMSWHDVPVHGISFGNKFDLLLDIDYIFKWVQTGKTYRFWIAPCTLAFENVYDFTIEADSIGGPLIIDEIERIDPQKPKNAAGIGRDIEYTWDLQLTNGIISFRSVGFRQIVRSAPQFLNTQQLDMDQRGGVSFSMEG